jgi:hypothetical protein
MKTMQEFKMDGWTSALVELGFFIGFEAAKRGDDDRNDAANCIDWVVVQSVLTNLRNGNIPSGGRDFVKEALLPTEDTVIGFTNTLLHAARRRESAITGGKQTEADEMYGFTFHCNHGEIFPGSQRFLNDEEQAALLAGDLPHGGRTRMCSDCFKSYNANTISRSEKVAA